MSASSYASLTLVVGAAVLFATCSGGPSAGELVVELSSSNGDTQAVQFTVTAAESKMVESASPACAGCQVFTVRVGDRDLRGVVTGSIHRCRQRWVYPAGSDGIHAPGSKALTAGCYGLRIRDERPLPASTVSLPIVNLSSRMVSPDRWPRMCSRGAFSVAGSTARSTSPSIRVPRNGLRIPGSIPTLPEKKWETRP